MCFKPLPVSGVFLFYFNVGEFLNGGNQSLCAILAASGSFERSEHLVDERGSGQGDFI
jgi:hypothetical protein